jgi:nicotinamidase-related amidase
MKALIVVDMQHDFIDGALGSAEATMIVEKVAEKVKQYNEDPGAVIIYTRDTHDEHYMDSFEGQRLPVMHCIENTPGWEIVPEVFVEGPNVNIIDKSTFGHRNIARVVHDFVGCCLESNEVESIELCGVCTDICVVSNAMLIKSAYMDIPIIVDSACCAGTTPENHQAALTVMRSCQIDVI